MLGIQLAVRKRRPGWRRPGPGGRVMGILAQPRLSTASGTPRARTLPWPAAGRAVAAVGVAVGVYLYVATFRVAFIDDAYIQLQYARDLASHHTWGFLPGRAANTSTSPLNVLLTALLYLIAGPRPEVVTWLTTAELLALFWLLLRIGRHLFGSPYFG